MAKVVIQHHVADFDAWYPVFTEHESDPRQARRDRTLAHALRR